MQYKTIVLELLQQYLEMHEQLRSRRKLLPALDHYSGLLKARHEAWTEHLTQVKPGSDSCQIASEALEIALQELEASLLSESPPAETDPLSLEAAMAFIRRTPPA